MVARPHFKPDEGWADTVGMALMCVPSVIFLLVLAGLPREPWGAVGLASLVAGACLTFGVPLVRRMSRARTRNE